jgi:hypothetical protein
LLWEVAFGVSAKHTPFEARRIRDVSLHARPDGSSAANVSADIRANERTVRRGGRLRAELHCLDYGGRWQG